MRSVTHISCLACVVIFAVIVSGCSSSPQPGTAPGPGSGLASHLQFVPVEIDRQAAGDGWDTLSVKIMTVNATTEWREASGPRLNRELDCDIKSAEGYNYPTSCYGLRVTHPIPPGFQVYGHFQDSATISARVAHLSTGHVIVGYRYTEVPAGVSYYASSTREAEPIDTAQLVAAPSTPLAGNPSQFGLQIQKLGGTVTLNSGEFTLSQVSRDGSGLTGDFSFKNKSEGYGAEFKIQGIAIGSDLLMYPSNEVSIEVGPGQSTGGKLRWEVPSSLTGIYLAVQAIGSDSQNDRIYTDGVVYDFGR